MSSCSPCGEAGSARLLPQLPIAPAPVALGAWAMGSHRSCGLSRSFCRRSHQGRARQETWIGPGGRKEEQARSCFCIAEAPAATRSPRALQEGPGWPGLVWGSAGVWLRLLGAPQASRDPAQGAGRIPPLWIRYLRFWTRAVYLAPLMDGPSGDAAALEGRPVSPCMVGAGWPANRLPLALGQAGRLGNSKDPSHCHFS